MQSSLPPRARRTGSTPEHQRHCPLAASLWATVYIFEDPQRLRTVTRAHCGEAGRATSEPVASQKGAGKQSQHLLGCSPVSNREFWRELKEDFSATHLSTGGPVGPCRAGRKDQAAQLAVSLLCAHRLFQNNSSAKPSDAPEGCGQVMIRFLPGHMLSPTYGLFFWSQCPYTEGS